MRSKTALKKFLESSEEILSLMPNPEKVDDRFVIAMTRDMLRIKREFFPYIKPSVILEMELLGNEYCPLCKKYAGPLNGDPCVDCPISPKDGLPGNCCKEWQFLRDAFVDYKKNYYLDKLKMDKRRLERFVLEIDAAIEFMKKVAKKHGSF